MFGESTHNLRVATVVRTQATSGWIMEASSVNVDVELMLRAPIRILLTVDDNMQSDSCARVARCR